MRIDKAVYLGEEECEDTSITEFQEGIAEDVAKKAGQMGSFLGERLFLRTDGWIMNSGLWS